MQTIYRNTCLDSSGPAGKLRGTPLQLNEKYTMLAKDASTASDMVLAEQYRQYADHYMRLQNLAIENENALRAQREAQQAALAEAAVMATESSPSEAEQNPSDLNTLPTESADKIENTEISLETK